MRPQQTREVSNGVDIRECDVFLVGSMVVPSDTVEEAMGIAAECIGDRLYAIPDGEVGPRLMWGPGMGALALKDHPDVVLGGEEDGFSPRDSPVGPLNAYRIRPGVSDVSLDGRFPYADAAISSYEHLREMRARGEVPADLKLQVALPTPMPVIAPFFGDAAEWPAMYRSVYRALGVEIARMLEVIPPEELSLQWDYCTEVCEIVDTANGRGHMVSRLGMTAIPDRSAEEAFEVHTAREYIEPMSLGVPDEVTFGYHLCIGTAPPAGFPSTPLEDLKWIVRIANRLVERTPHRVDFVHMPAMPDADRAFFAPLADLAVGDARVFLGLEQRDGVDRIVERGRACAEFLPDFGISHSCGYGREDADSLPQLLRDLREGADRLAAERAAQ